MHKGKIRSFIAIELDESIKNKLARIQNELKPANADVKWTKPTNIHLTLKFLGNIDESQVDKIKSALDAIASGYKPFEISLFKIGCFPRLENPRVIWVGIDKNCSIVEEIASKLENELENLGFEKEKRGFQAHLTLGRVRSPKNQNKLVEKVKALEFVSSAAMQVSKITLFQSTLTPKGSIYTVLHNSPLG